MTPTIIKINRLFSTAPYENIDLGMEATIDPGETYDEAVIKAHQQIMETFKKIYPPVTVNPEYAHLLQPTQQAPPREIKVDKVPEEERVSKLIEDLNTCTSVKILESYKLIAKLNPTVQSAYDLKLKELTEGK